MLYEADVRHIAEMKDRQWFLLKWILGLTIAYVGLAGRVEPLAAKQTLSLILIFVAGATAVTIWALQLSMRRKRLRLWSLYDRLYLIPVTGRSPRQRRLHISKRYNWVTWVSMMFTCLACAAIVGTIGRPFDDIFSALMEIFRPGELPPELPPN